MGNFLKFRINNFLNQFIKFENLLVIIFFFFIFFYFYSLILNIPIFEILNTKHFFWFDYLDQSLYFKSAKAITELNFSPNQHFYPLGYQIFASPLVFLFGFKGYFYLTLITFVSSLFFFYKISKNKFGFYLTSIIFILLLSNKNIFLELITPWTNNLTFLFFNIFFYFFFFKTDRVCLRFLPIIFFLILLTRPIDTLILIPFYIYYGLKFLLKKNINLENIFYLVFLSFFFLILFFSINKFIYNDFFSPYIKFGSSISLNKDSLFLKIFSFIFDGNSFYNLEKKMFLQLFPWLVFMPLSLIIFIKHKMFKVVIFLISIILNFIIYSSFSPIAPSTLYVFGTFRIFNLSIFYFSFLSFLAIYLVFKFKEKKLFFKYFFFLLFLVFIINLKIISIENKNIYNETTAFNVDNKVLINSKINNRVNKIEIKGFSLNDLNALYDHVRILTLRSDQQCYRSQIDYVLNLKNNSLTINLNKTINAKYLQIIIDNKVFTEKKKKIS